jgi:hypothetical protein
MLPGPYVVMNWDGRSSWWGLTIRYRLQPWKVVVASTSRSELGASSYA